MVTPKIASTICYPGTSSRQAESPVIRSERLPFSVLNDSRFTKMTPQRPLALPRRQTLPAERFWPAASTIAALVFRLRRLEVERLVPGPSVEAVPGWQIADSRGLEGIRIGQVSGSPVSSPRTRRFRRSTQVPSGARSISQLCNSIVAAAV